MTEYAADKEAKAVVLCHLTSVNYTMDLYNYLVDYHVKKRIKRPRNSCCWHYGIEWNRWYWNKWCISIW